MAGRLLTTVAAGVRVAWSVLVTVAVLGGGAAGLVWWARWPLPDRWPSSEQWAVFAEDPLTPSTVKALAVCAGWLLWLLLAAATALQLQAVATRRGPRLRFPRPIQTLVAGMLGAGVLAAAAPAHAGVQSDPANGAQALMPASESVTAQHHRGALPPIDEPTGLRSAAAPPRPNGVAAPADTAPGIVLPGGWITLPVAAGILASAAVHLLLHRHPLRTPTMLRILRAGRHATDDPTRPDPPASVDDIGLLQRDLAVDGSLCIGVHGDRDLGVDVLAPTGTGLTGPGADNAIRGLMIAVAAANDAAMITTAGLMTRLAVPPTASTKLAIAADTAQAMQLIQAEIHRRNTATTQLETSTRPDWPPVIVLTEPPDDHQQLAALATTGHPLGLHVVVAGAWLAGPTWHVDRHATATHGTAVIGRLNTLTAATLTAIAALLTPPPQPSRGVHTIAAPQVPPTVRPLRLHILGPLRLSTPGIASVHIRRSGAWQAAVYLALHPDGATRTDLLEAIFGHMRPANANTGLDSCLHDLRRALSIGDQTALQSVDARYRLDPTLIAVDWWDLNAHLRRAELHQAVHLYGGPIADGRTWDWLPEHRQPARHLVANTYARLAHAAATPADALDLALAGIDVDPYAQDCYEAAIRAHLQAGNIDRARTAYRDLAERLRPAGARPAPGLATLIDAGEP